MSNAETTYRQFGRLIELMPTFQGTEPLTNEQLLWIGRADALLLSAGLTMLWAQFDTLSRSISNTTGRQTRATEISMVLHKALAAVELKAPPAARGAFIPAGNAFDAFSAVTKVLQTARSDLFIVDPYMDEAVLTDFAGSIPDGVGLRLLADTAGAKASLAPAVRAWSKQHPDGALSLRLAAPRTLHDRAIFVDRTTGWILTQSLKDFAKRSPAEIVRADDTAALKIQAYEAIWSSADTHV